MATLSIEALLASSGSVPANGYDPLGSGGFTSWKAGDEARFSVVVPETYVAGNDAFLELQEACSTPNVRHAWNVTTVLLRPGVHTTSAAVAKETVSVESTASATPNQLTTRSLVLTGAAAPGKINGVDLRPGDLLACVLKRGAVSTPDDSVAVRLYDLAIKIRVDELAASDCPGRVGGIIDTVRDLFNETTGGFLPDAFILRAINRCAQELAQAGYWRKETWIPAVAGEDSIDLLAAVPFYQDLHQMRYSGSRSPMVPLASYREYEELRTGSPAGGTPGYYIVQNNRVSVWPAPSSGSDSGFCLYHSFTPQALTCSSDHSNPDVPRAHDMVFVYYVLKQAFLRDRHAPGADVKVQEYAQFYEAARRSLLGEGDPPGMSLRPGRSAR